MTGLQAIAQPKAAYTEIIREPIVINDRVTLKVKVTGDKETGSRPVVNLQASDFIVLVDGKEVKFNPRQWISAKLNDPPAYIIVLLDMSGSMRNRDAKNQVKLQGAVQSIKAILLSLAERTNTQVAIVPFGNAGGNCNLEFPVNNETLNRFFVAGDIKLKTYIESEIGSITPCSATNLYKALGQAVKFLGNSGDSRFYPSTPLEKNPEENRDNQEPQPKLSIILLSDGFDTDSFAENNPQPEEEAFEKLTMLLKSSDQVTIHTLGYGLTPAQLGKKYNLRSAATRKNVDVNNCHLDRLSQICKGSPPPVGKVPAEEFVDEKRLKDIADISGGLSAFGADAQEVAEELQVFLDAILGEYTITYNHPNPKRAKRHSVVVVADKIRSDSKPYRISVFGRTLSRDDRIKLLGIVTVVCVGLGSGLFLLWRNSLHEEMV